MTSAAACSPENVSTHDAVDEVRPSEAAKSALASLGSDLASQDMPARPDANTPPLVPLDKSEHRIRRMFGQIASRYDLLNHLLSAGIDHYWRWRTVCKAPPVGTAPVLDVCTGTGDLALAYWKRGRGGVRVVGADFTREMLVLARKKSARTHTAKARGSSAAPGIEYFEADAQHLPFADDQFQIVSVAFGLRNVREPRLGLREMIRVCQPGGRLAVLEFSFPKLWGLGGLYRWYFQNVLPRIGQSLARNSDQAYDYLPASVAQFPQGEDLAELMRACGCRRVEWHPLTLGIATLYVGWK